MILGEAFVTFFTPEWLIISVALGMGVHHMTGQSSPLLEHLGTHGALEVL